MSYQLIISLYNITDCIFKTDEVSVSVRQKFTHHRVDYHQPI